MRQFNLQEFLNNLNLKVVTKDGNPVRIICTNLKNGGSAPIIGLVDYRC